MSSTASTNDVRDPRKQLTEDVLLEKLRSDGPLAESDTGRLLQFLMGRNKGKLATIEQASGRAAQAKQHRAEAIAHYDTFLREFPHAKEVPEAMYFAGLEQERNGEPATAYVGRYMSLVQKYPQSEWVAYAQYGIGVGSEDPVVMREALTEAAKSPSPVGGAARTKLVELDSAAPAAR